MVGAVAIRPVCTDETALSLYQKNFFPERYPPSASATPLIAEIVEEREITSACESWGYDRFGRVSRIHIKGFFVDSYH
jgi:hypothetical protein